MSSNSLRHLTRINRRTLIGGAGGFALAHAAASKLGIPCIANAAASDPIRIGMIYAKTGAVADQAEYMAQGSLLALETRNNSLLGRQVEVIWLDEQTSQGAQQNAERLIGEHNVVGIVGGSLSSSALAISAVAKKAKIPFVASNAGAIDLTGRLCNKYTFRLQPPADVHTRVLAPYCAGLGKKWYLLTAAFAFGQDIQAFVHRIQCGEWNHGLWAPTRCQSTRLTTAPLFSRSVPPNLTSLWAGCRATISPRF